MTPNAPGAGERFPAEHVVLRGTGALRRCDQSSLGKLKPFCDGILELDSSGGDPPGLNGCGAASYMKNRTGPHRVSRADWSEAFGAGAES
jgi:hypothetical protein